MFKECEGSAVIFDYGIEGSAKQNFEKLGLVRLGLIRLGKLAYGYLRFV